MIDEKSIERDVQAATVGDLRLCFYGAGSMAEAIVRGLLAGGLTKPERIGMINRSNAERLAELNERYGIVAPVSDSDKRGLLADADAIFLCMKPKDAEEALRGLADRMRDGQLLVSVIAGLSTATIAKLVGRSVAVVRTMPNTSSTIGLGATGIAYNEFVSGSQRELVETMFRAVGVTAVVDEPLIDGVTAVSGSGPAYIYYVMEAMIQAGERLGLTSDAARDLTVQTVLGAASMVRSTGEQPAELRRKVTSPGGTTQAAIETLDRREVKDAIMQAMLRAAERAGEMGAAIERSAMR
jgi:pyrroline-5-carboxylate reductase